MSRSPYSQSSIALMERSEFLADPYYDEVYEEYDSEHSEFSQQVSLKFGEKFV